MTGGAPQRPLAPTMPVAGAAAAAALPTRLAREQEVLARLRVQFPTAVAGDRTFREQLWIDIAPGAIHNVLKFMRDDPALEFKLLTDLTCADFLKLPDWAKGRFGMTYILFSLKLDTRARLRCWLPAGRPEIQSVSDVFAAANWAEREVFDLYGIRFLGHPGLKRILMPDEYEGHPLRKDYPLKGRGERDSFPVVSRRDG